MKKLLNLILILNLSIVFAQETTQTENSNPEVSREQIETQIDQAVENAQSEEEKSMMRKFKDWTRGVAQSDLSKKTGRGLGKASALITTETVRPFIATGSFFRGLFSKSDTPETRMRSLAYTFYLENEEELNQLYKDPAIYERHLQENGREGIISSYSGMVQNLFKNKILNTIKGLLIDVNFNPAVEIAGNIKNLSDASSLEELAQMITNLRIEENPFILLQIDTEKLNNDTLRKNLACNNLATLSPHIDIAPLISSLTNAAVSGEGFNPDDYKKAISQQLLDDIDAFIAQFIEMENGIWKNKEIMTELGETTAGIVAQYAVPSLVLGGIVNGAGAAYLGVTALSTIGTGLSVATCTKNKNMDKLIEDPDFRNFCSYVIMRSSQKILKSKAKGFIAGQSLRNSIRMIGYRRNYIKDCMNETGKSRRSCRNSYNEAKAEYIAECMSLGVSKKECKRLRKEELLEASNRSLSSLN